MPRFISKDGKHTVTTTNPREQVQLRAQGFREVKSKPAARPAEPAKTDK